MERTKKTFVNAIFGVADKLIATIVTFVSRTIFIYTLGAEYLGVSSLFTSILTMLSLAELGFATAITYNLYKPLAKGNVKKTAAYMNFFRKVYIIVGIVILIVGLMLMPFLKEIISDDVPNIKESIYLIYFLYLLNTAISYFLVYKATLLEANQNKYIVSVSHAIVSVIKTIANSIALIITKNFILYLIIEIVCTVLYNLIISFVADKKYKEILGSKESKLNKREKKLIFNNVKAMFLYKFCAVILDGTDNIIISRYLGTVMVGIYSNYYTIINQVFAFILQIIQASTASIGNLAVEKGKEDQERVFKNIIFLSFIIYFICSALLFNCLNPFITLWLGESYLLETSVVVALVFNFYTTGMLSPVTAFRTANGLFMQGKYRPLIMAILNIIISIVLVKVMGLIGVFIGTIIARLVTQVWYDPYLIYKKAFGKSPKIYFKKYILYILVTIIGCVIIYEVNQLLNIKNLIIQLLFNVIFSIVVVTLMTIIIFRNTPEYIYVKDLAKKILNKLKSKIIKK